MDSDKASASSGAEKPESAEKPGDASIFRKDLPAGFDTPIGLPSDSEAQRRWQQANRAWWESHPMRYDWGSKNPHASDSSDFFNEIDRVFFEATAAFMPWQRIPFDPLIDFDALRGQDVLEIGVGAGTHAELLSRHARTFTGIDLTEAAVNATSRRLALRGLPGRVVRMDAEAMQFSDDSFDLIWSWGVIHHSSNTRRVLEEMRRVLRPGGRATVMVYHRNWWNYYVAAGLCEGILKADLLRTRSIHKTMQNRWDGALARFYTRAEWQSLVGDLFVLEDSKVYGQRSEVFPLNVDRLRYWTLRLLVPIRLSRFLTNRCGLGSFLVTTLRKPA
jgi:ubiquinone/menaquinone biosynthesis C-methylase UbiE